MKQLYGRLHALSDDVRRVAIEQGMSPLRNDGLTKARMGQT